jgi:hypothetical protein
MSSSEPLKAEDQIVEADDAITGDALADSDKIDSKVMDSRGVSVHHSSSSPMTLLSSLPYSLMMHA